MIRYIFIFFLLINLNQANNENIVSNIVDDIQQQINISCFCTEDERCEPNSRRCRLSNSDQACYESWTKIPGEDTIQISAGYVKKTMRFFLFHKKYFIYLVVF